jgi:hypothetical protein
LAVPKNEKVYLVFAVWSSSETPTPKRSLQNAGEKSVGQSYKAGGIFTFLSDTRQFKLDTPFQRVDHVRDYPNYQNKRRFVGQFVLQPTGTLCLLQLQPSRLGCRETPHFNPTAYKDNYAQKH